MLRVTSLGLVLLLVAPLAAAPPAHDPAVACFLGDEVAEPAQDTLFVTADVYAGGRWSGANSRLLRGPLSGPLRTEMSLGENALRIVVRIDGDRLSYEVEAVGPALPAEEGAPDGDLRVVLRGTRAGTGPLATLPLARAEGPAEVRVRVTATPVEGADIPLETGVRIALVSRPPGATEDQVLRSHTLHLAPDAVGEVESRVERNYLLDYDVEICQSPLVPVFDPVPGAVPAGLAATLLPAGNDLEVLWSYSAVLRTEEWEGEVFGISPAVRICLPVLGETRGCATHRGEVTRRPIAALADGGTLFLEVR